MSTDAWYDFSVVLADPTAQLGEILQRNSNFHGEHDYDNDSEAR